MEHFSIQKKQVIFHIFDEIMGFQSTLVNRAWPPFLNGGSR